MNRFDRSMNSRLLAVTATLVLTLAGCGDDEETDPVRTPATTTSTDGTSPEATTPTTTTTAAPGGPFKCPLSLDDVEEAVGESLSELPPKLVGADEVGPESSCLFGETAGDAIRIEAPTVLVTRSPAALDRSKAALESAAEEGVEITDRTDFGEGGFLVTRSEGRRIAQAYLPWDGGRLAVSVWEASESGSTLGDLVNQVEGLVALLPDPPDTP